MANDRPIPSLPSNLTGPLAAYLLDLSIVIRGLADAPKISAFSGTDPNGVVSGYPGDLAVNLTSASSDLRLYQKGGSVRVPSKTGWVLV